MKAKVEFYAITTALLPLFICFFFSLSPHFIAVSVITAELARKISFAKPSLRSRARERGKSTRDRNSQIAAGARDSLCQLVVSEERRASRQMFAASLSVVARR